MIARQLLELAAFSLQSIIVSPMLQGLIKKKKQLIEKDTLAMRKFKMPEGMGAIKARKQP